jgi:hypothetical protein
MRRLGHPRIFFKLTRYLLGMAGDHISVKWHGKREEHRYGVSPDQLDRIESAGGNVGFNFQIAQFLLTLAFSFFATLMLSPPAPGTKRTVFVSIVVFGFLLGPIFALKWYLDRGAFGKIIREIRELPEIGPVGEEGKELKPADLAELPPTEPPRENQP